MRYYKPLETMIRVCYRVDGMLKETMGYDLNLMNGILTRVRIINGDLAEYIGGEGEYGDRLKNRILANFDERYRYWYGRTN